MNKNDEVMALVADLVNVTVQKIDSVEDPFNLEDIMSVAGLYYSCVVRWAIRDNPETEPSVIAGTFFENLRTGLNFLVNESKKGAANDE